MASQQYEELEEAAQRPFNYGYLKRMLRYALPYRRMLIGIIVAMTLASSLRLIEPYLVRNIIDNGITAGNLAVINRMAGFWLAIQIIAGACDFVRIRMLNRTGQQILFDMRQELFDHIQWLSLRFYDGRPVGRVMSRVTNDVEAINNLINSGLVTIISQSVSLIGIVVIMFVLNWRLALIAFTVLPALVWAIGRLRPAMEAGWRNVRKTNSNINAYLNESVSGIRVTQAFCRERENEAQFEKLNDSYYYAFLSAIKKEVLIWPMGDVFSMIGSSLVLWYGARMVFRGALTVGYVMAFVDYLWRFWDPIRALSRVYSRVLSAMASAERIFGYLDTEPEIVEWEDAVPLANKPGHVRFEHVWFRYEEDGEYVLKDIDIEIQPGETVALVGPTGAGKSSIINTLMRFYDPQKGRILVNGHDLRGIELASLRAGMALVLQEPFLFSGSILDNIRYSRPGASQEEVIRVAKAVQVDNFASGFSEGYQHEVGERGGSLSAGQRQLVSFARALLVNPSILILDEATAAVDTQTEGIIQEAMDSLLAGRTAIVIAHRLSTIRRADRILVIEDGRIVEEGTHDDLIESGGAYARLYRRQFTPWENELTA